MIGGLMKSTSSLALTMAAGLALSANAYAADLGGNCCADLEERVAELEATTARKGNRKVSLTISGQVNRTIMYYNDGGRSNTFFGLDNTNSSTRFGMSGSATINSEWKAGFAIVLDVADAGRAVTANQLNEDGGSLRGGNVTSLPFRTNTNADPLPRIRNAFWYLESSRIGRINVGRFGTSGSAGVVDLGGISVAAATGEGCVGTSLQFRDAVTGNLTGRNIGTYSMACSHPTYRAEAIQYVSPTMAGFTFSASVGESAHAETSTDNNFGPTSLARREALGTNYGADLKYANEFNGVRVAAVLGWERSKLNDDDGVSYNSDYEQIGLSGSILHVPTGLFAQAYWTSARSAPFDASSPNPALPTSASVGLTGDSTTSTMWHLQGGVARNWFGIGNTVLFAEYGRFDKWAQAQTASLTNFTTSFGVTGDKMTMWGLGAVQNIDAAAMELYLGYRNYKASDVTPGVSMKDIDVLHMGARIKF